jgi:hypothetical protein
LARYCDWLVMRRCLDPRRVVTRRQIKVEGTGAGAVRSDRRVSQGDVSRTNQPDLDLLAEPSESCGAAASTPRIMPTSRVGLEFGPPERPVRDAYGRATGRNDAAPLRARLVEWRSLRGPLHSAESRTFSGGRGVVSLTQRVSTGIEAANFRSREAATSVPVVCEMSLLRDFAFCPTCADQRTSAKLASRRQFRRGILGR